MVAVRGRRDPQVTILAFIDLETRVPADHPLRLIKAVADKALAALPPDPHRVARSRNSGTHMGNQMKLKCQTTMIKI